MDHRSYQSILPSHNKLLQKRWDQQQYNTHRGKVRSSSCIVDTKAPKAHMHVQMKIKKQQMEEERLAIIERDNRMLLEKMSIIMRSRGRVDDRNLYEHKSLNKEKRERELLRVAEENKGILRRLQAVKPLYNKDQWESDFHGHETLMESISMYPLGTQTWPAHKQKQRRGTKSTGGITLPPLPPKKKEPTTKMEKVKDSSGTNGKQQHHQSTDKEAEEKLEKVKTSKEVTETSSMAGAEDTSVQEEGDKESTTAEQTDQTKTDVDQPLTQDSKQENDDDKKGDKDTEDNKHENEQDDKQTDQQREISDQADDKQDEKQEVQSHDNREEKRQDEQDVSEDVKDDDKQENKQEDLSDNSYEKTGVDLDVEVTHQLLEEKKSDLLIELLLQHNEVYLSDLKDKYREQYDKDLLEEIQSAFTNPLANALCAAFRTLAEFDAWCLHEAVSGKGMTERFVFEVLGSRSNEVIKGVRVAYEKMYNKQLDEDVQLDASGDFEKLLIDIVKGDRVEDRNVDQQLAEAEATELHEAGEDSFGRDDSALIRVLANRSHDQLVATFQEYEKAAGSTILEAIKSETSDDRLLGLRTLVLLAVDPWKLAAERLHNSLEDTGKEGEVTRVAFGTPPNARPSLKERYRELYNESLLDATNEKLNGDYAKLIVGLLAD